MTYVLLVFEYWFVQREKLKSRSNLHNYLLQRKEESKTIEFLLKYFKKFKKIPNSKKAVIK